MEMFSHLGPGSRWPGSGGWVTVTSGGVRPHLSVALFAGLRLHTHPRAPLRHRWPGHGDDLQHVLWRIGNCLGATETCPARCWPPSHDYRHRVGVDPLAGAS